MLLCNIFASAALPPPLPPIPPSPPPFPFLSKISPGGVCSKSIFREACSTGYDCRCYNDDCRCVPDDCSVVDPKFEDCPRGDAWGDSCHVENCNPGACTCDFYCGVCQKPFPPPPPPPSPALPHTSRVHISMRAVDAINISGTQEQLICAGVLDVFDSVVYSIYASMCHVFLTLRENSALQSSANETTTVTIALSTTPETILYVENVSLSNANKIDIIVGEATNALVDASTFRVTVFDTLPPPSPPPPPGAPPSFPPNPFTCSSLLNREEILHCSQKTF